MAPVRHVEAPAGHRRRRGGLAAVLAGVLVTALGLLTPTAASAADTTGPTQPGPITVSSVTATSAALRWTASTDASGIEGYRVYRGPAGAPASGLSLIATTDAVTSYSATRLYSGTAYTFGVVAIDASNNPSPIRTTTVTTAGSSDTTPPATPSSTSVSFRVFSDSRIDIVWGAVSSSDVAGYRVLRDGAVVGTVDLPGTPRYSDNGLSPGTSHSYSIKAVDSAGNVSAGSTAKTAKTLAAGTVIIARGPYLSRVGATSGVVSWWTNRATTGSVSIAGRSVADAGTVQHHEVTVTGLSAGTSYPYTVSSGGVTAAGTLRTAARPGQTFSFAALGDFGGGSTGETQNANRIAAAGTEFIQTLGDNVYPSSGLPDPDFSTTYSDFDQRFFKPFATAARSQAFFPANGNKEYYGDGEFWAAFPMPGSNHSWYSYDWGDAHLLVLDSEQSMATGSEQYAFAQADLAAHQSAAWRIVALQRPPYSSTTANSSSKPVQTYLVPLFQQQNVDLVLSGNSHNYERTYPLLNGAPATGGITYVVSGAGGNGFNAFSGTAPAYSAFRESSYYQYAQVTVSPTALTVDGIRADTGAVFDTTTLTRGSGTDSTPPSAPSGLSAGTPTSSTVPLSWTANPAADGVTGYRVHRSGASTATATSSGTSYTDTGLAASSTYSYTLTAVDAAGNESAASGSVSVTTAGATGGTVKTLLPVADATIDPAVSVPPTSTRLKVDATSPTNDLLMRFDSGCTRITAASLRLTVGSGSTDPSVRGGDFYGTSATDPHAGWAESSVLWTSAPAADTSAVASISSSVAASTSYTLDVLAIVPAGGGTFTLRGTSPSGDGAGYYSKEGKDAAGAVHPPQLTVTCS